jgi:hypothetical protein
MRFSHALAVLVLVVSTVACSSSSSPQQQQMMMQPPPPPTSSEVDIVTSDYTVQPGQEIRYSCFTMRLPADADTYITQVEPVYGKATHHLAVYYTLADEPDGSFDCSSLFKTTWIPIYGGGVQSGTLTMPQGSAFHLQKNQQILVQLHLLNASQEPVTDKATIKLSTSADTTLTPAGVWGMMDTQISIPPNAPGDITMDCSPKAPMNVFAVLGHMHQLGTHIELTQNGVTPPVFAENWNFNDQPTVPQIFQVNAGDALHLHCQYDNTTSKTVTYGESSFDEMCVMVLYYTPFTTIGGCYK